MPFQSMASMQALQVETISELDQAFAKGMEERASYLIEVML